MPTSPPEAVRRQPGARALPVAASVMMALVVLAHAGLIGHSRWQADEYQQFALLHRNGLGFALGRFLAWGPRPWSELLGTFYGLIVNRVHRPLAGSCIAVLWAGLAAGCLLPAWCGAGRAAPATRWSRLLLGLSIFALFLLGHPMTEVFFWPAGGLAYLPTLAASAWLFWCLEGDITSRAQGWNAAGALMLAAGSSEVGLFLTVLFSCFVALRSGGGSRARLWWLLPGLALAVPLVILLLHGRVGNEQLHGQLGGAVSQGVADVSVDRGPVFHRAGASLLAAVPEFVREAMGFGDDGMDTPPALKIFAAMASFFGARWHGSGRVHAGAGRFLPHLAGALLLAAFCTIAAADYQFGKLCCQRHETMRGCFFVLAAISLGAASTRWRSLRRPPNGLSAMALSLPVLLLFAVRLPALIDAYRSYPQTIAARAATWRSGRAQGGDDMIFFLEPESRLISSGRFLAPGSYALGPDSPWYLTGVLAFFDKGRMRVIAAPP